MRDIKFRYWDGKSCYLSETLEPCAELFVEPDVIDIMQYTGLKDKKGEEIYEGDIVKEDGFPLYLVVIWHDGCFDLVSDASHHSRLFGGPYGSDKLKVIGNVYQDPELLTASQA